MTTIRAAGIKPLPFLIVLFPVAVFLISNWLLQNFGEPLDVPPNRIAEFDVYKEGAARVGAAAGFILFVSAAGAALAYFAAITWQTFGWTLRLLVFAAFVAFALAGYLIRPNEPRGAELYPGKTLFCVATRYSSADSGQARNQEKTALEAEALTKARDRGGRASGGAQPRTRTIEAADPPALTLPAGVALKHLPYGTNCTDPSFERAGRLAHFQYLGIVVAFAAIAIGAVCCLAAIPASPQRANGGAMAGGAGGTGTTGEPEGAATTTPAITAQAAAEADLSYWEAQSGRLNIYLYLGALVLGTALLFIGAYLRWPSYVLQSTEAYEGYLAGLLSYYGFTFTAMLAAFYIPIAATLAARTRKSAAAATGEAKLPEAFKGPLQLLKIVLGLASTALAGVLPGIIDFIA